MYNNKVLFFFVTIFTAGIITFFVLTYIHIYTENFRTPRTHISRSYKHLVGSGNATRNLKLTEAQIYKKYKDI